jgi:rhamnogalacturonyl hydrolase YesR
MVAGGLLLSMGIATACAQQLPYTQPTPVQQAIIDKDISRHFGDAPEDPGPLATDLSSALTPAAIDKAVTKVADWQLARSQQYFDRIWTWSVLYSGFLAASEETGNPKYRDAMLAISEKFEWKLGSSLSGRLTNADDQSLSQTYLDLYLAESDAPHPKAWIAPTQAAMDSVIDLKTLTPTDPRLPWWWCDALFMAPPAWVRMYVATGDHKYIDYLNVQWQATSDLLYDKQQHLYARDATYIPKTEANGKKMFWSRGEGWVMGGLVRTLEYLPKDDPRRPFYVQQLQEMAASVRALQGPDGLWHAGLLDPEFYPLPEVSGSALFTYAMAWGINHGVLPATTYKPVVAKAWKGMLSHVYADGRLGCIQQTGAEPAFYRPSSSYTYGVGAFLLAGSELKIMAQGGHPPRPK